jgi:hypothetical protein
MHPTVIIAPLLSRILFRYLRIHCTIRRPLWYTDKPGSWHSPRHLHARIGANTGPIPSFLEDNLTMCDATCDQNHSAETMINPTITACIEAFSTQPPPLRVVVISGPQVGYAITDRVVNMPQEGVSITGTTIYSVPAHTLQVHTRNHGNHFSQSMNALPLVITVVDSINAPSYDLTNLLLELDRCTNADFIIPTPKQTPAFPVSFPPPLPANFTYLPFLAPGPQLIWPRPSPNSQPPAEHTVGPSYVQEDPLHTLAAIMGEPPNKLISKYLKQAGQHTGNQDDEHTRVTSILQVLRKTTLQSHARLFAWHCATKYGTHTGTDCNHAGYVAPGYEIMYTFLPCKCGESGEARGAMGDAERSRGRGCKTKLGSNIPQAGRRPQRTCTPAPPISGITSARH